MIRIPRNVPQYNALKLSGRPIAVVFVQNNCASCDTFLSHAAKLAALNPRILFVEINVNRPQFTNIQDALDIKAYPTTKFFQNQVLTARVVRANELKLNEEVEKILGAILLPQQQQP